MLAIYRAGIFITIPGIDRLAAQSYLKKQTENSGGFLNLFNFFSGGALENASIFALGVMPYITTSIIMTLLTIVIPSLEKMQKESEQTRRKMNEWIRRGAVFISTIQSFLIAQSLKTNDISNTAWTTTYHGYPFIIHTIVTLTAGTIFIMWLGEKITKHGIGNGISLIIFSGIVSRLPQVTYITILGLIKHTYQPSEIFLIVTITFLCLGGIIFIEKAQRQIPIKYTNQVAHLSGNSPCLPLKINIAGVMPPIFASTILIFPLTFSSYFNFTFSKVIQKHFSPGTWKYETIFVLLIIFFSFFYASIQFSPVDIADNMRKSGSFIPGIRPGEATSNFIAFILNRLIFIGSVYLSVICILPMLIQKISSNQIPFYFGGTGVLIVVSVALEITQQIKNYHSGREYRS